MLMPQAPLFLLIQAHHADAPGIQAHHADASRGVMRGQTVNL